MYVVGVVEIAAGLVVAAPRYGAYVVARMSLNPAHAVRLLPRARLRADPRRADLARLASVHDRPGRAA